jgi:hypothetical protein
MIDGTIEEATRKRSFYRMQVFDPVIIRRSDGTIENLGKRIIHSDLADVLAPGRSGRFYLYSTFEHSGIHGFRGGGEAVFAFARNNEIAGVACVVLGVLMYALHFYVRMPLSGWAPILIVLGAVLGFVYWRVRQDAGRQFDQDQATHDAGLQASAT